MTLFPPSDDIKLVLIALLTCGCGERNLAIDTHFTPEAVLTALRTYFPTREMTDRSVAEITERMLRLKLVWGFTFRDETVISLTDEGFDAAEALYDERFSLGFARLVFATPPLAIEGGETEDVA